jgi:hypothetical protein
MWIPAKPAVIRQACFQSPQIRKRSKHRDSSRYFDRVASAHGQYECYGDNLLSILAPLTVEVFSLKDMVGVIAGLVVRNSEWEWYQTA